MATLTWNASYGFNLKSIDFSNLVYGYSYTRSSSLFSVNYDSGGYSRDEFRGSGFTYNAEGIPTGGVVRSYAAFSDGRKVGFIDGARIEVSDLVKAAMTYSRSDDTRVIKAALSGNDALTGGSYNDRLEGFGGNDKLYGRQGADKLFGGSGADAFRFKSIKDSTVETYGRDTIYDFSATQGDKIDLKAIDAKTTVGGNQAFTFIGKNGFHDKAGELRYDRVLGGSVVSGDVNGDGNADFAIYLKGISIISKSDFIL